VQPLVGFIPSLFRGAVGTALALLFARTLPLVGEHRSSLLVPAALSTALTGFLVLTSRRKAILQVLGYLLLENGTFVFGTLLLEAMPLLVEAGVLLDLFTGVFIMGIIIHHINREFTSVDGGGLAGGGGMTTALALILVPLALAAAALALPSNRRRPWLLPPAALAHLLLTAVAVWGPPVAVPGGWLVLDPLGKLVLGLVSVLFFLCACHAPGYLALRPDKPNRAFCACLLAALAMITLVALAHHLGLMWVGMEATTLATAPLLYFNRSGRSLEAT
jgi:hypothetical protein